MECGRPARTRRPSRLAAQGDRARRPIGAGGTPALLAALLLLACAQTHVDRAHWQRMSTEDKTLYVRSLLGREKVKEAKGGNARAFERPAEEYARRIDEAYARGERRDVDALFEEMGSKR
ncbi:MAG: hypothetical protein AABO58_21365 [Acidobacteriota bacterium]